jgi:Bacterial Ig domain
VAIPALVAAAARAAIELESSKPNPIIWLNGALPSPSPSTEADGSFRYTPDSGGSGSDSFQYTISDGQGGWNVGTVSLTGQAPGAWG